MQRRKSESTIHTTNNSQNHSKEFVSTKKKQKRYSIQEHYPQISQQPIIKMLKQINLRSLNQSSKDILKKNINKTAKIKSTNIDMNHNAILMKKDLKEFVNSHLTSKNMTKKQKDVKQLKINKKSHLHHFQSQNKQMTTNKKNIKTNITQGDHLKKPITKRNIWNNPKMQQIKSSKLVMIKQQLKQQLNQQQKQRNRNTKDKKSYESTRHSLDCNHFGVQKSIIQEAIKIRPRNVEKIKNSCQKIYEGLNFIEMYKNYKKCFDVSYKKITINGETSLSRHNSSSLTSSRLPSYRQILKQNSSKNKQHLLNHNQCKYNDNQNYNKQLLEIKHVQNIDTNSQALIISNKKKFDKTIQINHPIKPFIQLSYQSSIDEHHFINEQSKQNIPFEQTTSNKEQVEIVQNKQRIIEFEQCQDNYTYQHNQNQQENTNFFIAQQSNFHQQKTYTTKQPISFIEKQKIDKHFENSKYYVRPIPIFTNKVNQLQHESPINKKNSNYFIGLQIEQIENNITIDAQLDL